MKNRIKKIDKNGEKKNNGKKKSKKKSPTPNCIIRYSMRELKIIRI